MTISERILLKNNQLFAVNKPAGIPVLTDKTGDKTLQSWAEAYCKHTLFLPHRIDRPVSGIVLFVKSKSAQTAITEQFRQKTIDKEYLAIVHNPVPNPTDTVQHWLVKNEPKNQSFVVPEGTPGAELAELQYTVLKTFDNYSLLSVRIFTGRHHQIRVQLAAIGCPIKGDVKYGARRGNKDRSIDLHAWKMAFNHPVTGERIELEAPLPEGVMWQVD